MPQWTQKLAAVLSVERIARSQPGQTLAAIFFSESQFFTKLITDEHPLAALKLPEAGVFLGDTDTEAWRTVHKFLPPALGPKAVRHYAPEMGRAVESSFKVFDELDARGEAFNVYQYMLKLGSQAVGKLVLGLDFNHFESPETPLHEMVMLIAQVLALNKKVTTRGNWYASLPFGDPQKLRLARLRIMEMIDVAIKAAQQNGTEDLDLQNAALKAANFVGKLRKKNPQVAFYLMTASFRLRHSSNRFQRQQAAGRELCPGPDCRDWCGLHHDELSPILAHLFAGRIPRRARRTSSGACRQRLQR